MKIKHVLMTLALAAATLTATGQSVTTDAGQTYAPADLTANTLANATTLTISGTWTASQVDSRLRAAIAGTTSGSNAVLTTVTFEPDAVMGSMKNLFRNCTALTGVMMPTAQNSDAVSFLNAFNGCTALTGTVSLSAFTGISSMQSAFEGCILLEGVTMPATNTAPDAGVNFFNAFKGCTALQSVDLSVFTAISSMSSAFEGCTALEGVTLPAANTAPSSGVSFTSAFQNCTALTGTVDVSGFTAISNMASAFKGCTGITGVKFSATENTAAGKFNSAFSGCTALQSVDLSKFTAISNMGSAFEGCASLTSVKLGGALPATTSSAFSQANGNCLVYVPAEWGAKPSGWYIIYIAGGTAVGNISLKYDKPFRCPEAFTIGTGNRITYQRYFEKQSGIGGAAAGWETLCLPFTPTLVRGLNVVGDSVTLAPFNAEGTYEGKGTAGIVPFWLRSLSGTGYQAVTTIEPDKPYILAMPNNTAYDTKFNVKGTVTFSAVSTADAPVTVGVTPDVLPSVTGASYTLHGNYSTVPAAQSMYVINTEGTAFVSNGGDARPFRPYVTANNPMGAPARFVIGEDEGGATAIEEAVLMGQSDGNGAASDGLRVYGSAERGALVVEAAGATASTVDVVAIDGRVVRTVSLHEGVNVVNGLAAGVYVVGGQKAVVR